MLTENPKLVVDSETLVFSSQIGFREMGTQKITISDHDDGGFVDKNINSECFVVDIDYLSFGTERDITGNSRSTNVQRSLSRKGTQRGKANQAHQKDAHNNAVTSVAAAASLGGGGGGGIDGAVVDHDDHSPKKGSLIVGTGGCASDKPSIIVVGGGGATKEMNMMSNNINNTKTIKETVTVTAESRPWKRSNSLNKQRSSSSWLMDPRRILFFFATLSSMGTIILIYFTLSMTKLNGDDPSLSHAQ